ncbi:MAG: NAD(P)-binding protein [Pseudomonadales bacterium]|nr:NAD(P)-binding protein [Pseudomonadales bacterium]
MPRSKSPIDVAIVGAGIGGSALAVVLARHGLNVLMLEKSTQHKDVVRGEWLAPWGVHEANKLSLTELYVSSGAHRPTRHIGYSEFESAEDSEAQTLQIEGVAKENPICLGHPNTCNALNEEAVRLGVEFHRGITSLKVTPGSPPQLEYVHADKAHTVQPRWIVGADGRNGVVAQQVGCVREQDEEHHLFSGMLVEDAHDWPEDLQVIASEGDVNVLAFPQGGGKVRIYLGWPSQDRGRLVGPNGPQRFLDAWQVECVPHADAIVKAKPISPCIAYPNSDSWLDSPVREGVVLIGDAAGRNDPIIGQGLSITHRDVNYVSSALLETTSWGESMFAEYISERKERMARLRTVARLTSLKESAFGQDGAALRVSIHERLANKPDLAAPFSAGFVGPHNLPAEVFSAEFAAEIVGAPIWDEHL